MKKIKSNQTWLAILLAALLVLPGFMFTLGFEPVVAQAQTAPTPGPIKAWGGNAFGELGNGTTTASATPVAVKTINDAISIKSGRNYNLALRADGTVWAWGNNAYGKLGDGTTTNRNEPVAVSGLNNITAIMTSYQHSLALKSDGTVWAWGYNDHGQLGDGTTINRYLPVQVSGLTGVTALAAGASFSLALKADGTVTGWGYNYYGQLGNTSRIDSLTPISISSSVLSGVIAIAAGWDSGLALKQDGTVWAWGLNDHGQLGTTPDLVSAPAPVSDISGVKSLSAGNNHLVALKQDGTVWTWGLNQAGQLGNGTYDNNYVPTQVAGLSDIRAIAAGELHSLALRADGTVAAWGNNAYRQLGDGTTTSRPNPVTVSGLTNAVALEGGNVQSLALVAPSAPPPPVSGPVQGWGNTYFGQLGAVRQNRFTPAPVAGLTGITRVSSNFVHSLYLKEDGTVLAMGTNYSGLLGNGTISNSPNATPGVVSGLTNVVAIDTGTLFSMALKSDGTVWTWGNNEFGQLGNGTLTDNPWPGPVYGLGDVIAIAAGDYHSLALRVDGTVWAWGNNTSGAIVGSGYSIKQTTPVPVNGLSNVKAISTGNSISLALKNDGTVWVWDATRPVPVSLGVSGVTAIECGTNFNLLLKADGTVWAWGNNTFGELGNGTYTSSDVPVPVSGLTNVKAISAGGGHSLAIRQDGTVWAWGDNRDGQLGDGTTTNRNLPAQIAGLTNATAVATGVYNSIAVADNTLPIMSYNPTSIDFGDQLKLTTSTPVPVTISNNGYSELRIDRIELIGTNPADFPYIVNFPIRVAPGASTTIHMTFRPSAYGPRSGSFRMYTNVAPSTADITMTGYGIANSALDLTPATGTAQTGSSYRLTATAREDNQPLAGQTVTFTVASGPQANITGTAVTDAAGVATFSYTGTATGTDEVKAVVVDSSGRQKTATASVEWKPSNHPPVAQAGGPYSVVEGGTVALTGSGSDPDGDPLSYSWDLDGDGVYETTGANATLRAGDGPASLTASLKVCDNRGLCATAQAAISVTNQAPTATLNLSATTINEGGQVTLSLINPVDPSSADVAAGFGYAYDCGQGYAAAAGCTFADNGSFTVRGKISDKDGGSNEYTATVTVNNVAPQARITSLETAPVLVNTPITVTAVITEPGRLDNLAVEWQWGDGSTAQSSLLVPNGTATVSATKVYTSAGVYTLRLKVTDKDGASGEDVILGYVAVYNPSGGYVTGHGQIDSPAGACQYNPACQDYAGRAKFSFLSEYRSGTTVPRGDTTFELKAVNFEFKSSAYEWLVISGSKGQFKGSGTVNGSGDYAFMITVIDGDRSGQNLPDRFRLKIWNKATGAVVYDNQPGAADTADPTTPTRSGNIIIRNS